MTTAKTNAAALLGSHTSFFRDTSLSLDRFQTDVAVHDVPFDICLVCYILPSTSAFANVVLYVL